MFDTLYASLGYRFRDESLLILALTHPSCTKEAGIVSNQRLEFLGDAVLGLAVAEMVYQLFPAESEGDLSKRLVGLVNGERLAQIALAMGLADHLRLSRSESEQGGRTNPSNLEDACEALLGALYLDGGIEAVRAVVQRHWLAIAQASALPPKDPKTTLQEWAQARGLPLPHYQLLRTEGASHAPRFVVEVRVEGYPPTQAEAGVKRHAERFAAAALLAQIAEH